MDRLIIQDVEFDISKAGRIREDIPCQKTTTEKITVSRQDVHHLERTEKPKYPKDLDIGHILIDKIPEEKEVKKHEVVRKDQMRPKSIEVSVTQHEVQPKPYMEIEESRYCKDLDIGRIVIEETPEEKEEIPKREVSKKAQTRPKSIEVTATQHEVEEHPFVTEDVIKVGKLDVTHLEKKMVEAETVQERIKSLKDRVDGVRKVNNFFLVNNISLTICIALGCDLIN